MLLLLGLFIKITSADPDRSSTSTQTESLSYDIGDLVKDILVNLGSTPPPGQFLSDQDVNYLAQAANLSQRALNQATQQINQYDANQYNPYPSDPKPPPYDPYKSPYYPPDPPPHWAPEKKSNDGLKIGLGVGIGVPLGAAVVALIIYLCYRYRKKKAQRGGLIFPLPKQDPNYQHYIRQQDSPLASEDPWTLSPSKISIDYDKKLGSGAFCNVFQGYVIGPAPVTKVLPGPRTANLKDFDVAVKMLPSFADDIARSDFMQEINFMKTLAYHPHLVSMLGFVADRKNPFLLVELCEKGDLLHFIRGKKEEIKEGLTYSGGLKVKDLLSFSWQISSGLEYLNSIGCIHRDVAARNVLVDKDNFCKIGDFGLCRLTDSLLYTARGGRLPLKWMAPESLSSYEYSFKSDVWSYGVLLWELFSLGEVPFSGIQTTDLFDFLEGGSRPDQPDFCTDEMYAIMAECWEFDAGKRPTFTKICQTLREMLDVATESYGYLIPNKRQIQSISSSSAEI